MLNKKTKIAALLSVSLMTAPLFAAKIDKDSIGAPQPYVLNLAADVEINFQTINDFNPTSSNGPTSYTGKPTVSMSVSNNSAVNVTVECSGTIDLRICAGTDITNCIFNKSAQGVPFTTSDLSVSVNAGTSDLTSFTPTNSTQTSETGWILEVYNSVPLSCTIADATVGSTYSITKEYYIPVA